MADIPQPTIYRHVRLLHENNILTVVKEQKIRGTYKREYGLKLLSDEEMESFKEELFGVIKKHINFLPEAGRKMRSIAVISSPCNGEDITKGD